VADLRLIKKADLIAYFDRVVALNAPERKKLAVMVYSHQCIRDPKAVQTAFDELGGGDAKANISSQVIIAFVFVPWAFVRVKSAFVGSLIGHTCSDDNCLPYLHNG
jgi:hypothetical protein